MSALDRINNVEGMVLLDNTTVYSAKYAYETWPPAVTDWLRGLNALNLRSLMDIIESVVLYDTLVVDASSRMVDVEYGKVRYENIWNDLDKTRDEYHREVLVNVPFAHVGKLELLSPLIKTAFERLQEYLHDGTFVNELKRFQGTDLDFVVPKFYRSTEEFSELFTQSFSINLPNDVLRQLEQITNLLGKASHEESNYAMFAFRGFYYQEIARLFSISYCPHTWRSNLISISTKRPPINFAKYVTQVTGQVRQELAAKLNGEFSTDLFTSEFPVISTYVAHQCSHRGQLLKSAMEIRNSKSVKAFRRWITGVQSSIRNEQDLPKVEVAKSELEAIMNDIRKELGLLREKKTEQLKIKLGIPIASVEMPATISLGLPQWLGRIFHRRSHLVFLRDIAKKSVSLSPFAHRYYQLQP